MDNRKVLGDILSCYYNVSYADNVPETIEILKKRDYDFSLIMLDLISPEEECFKFLELRQKNSHLKNIPVIVMTSDKNAKVKSIRLGASDFIMKPYDMPEVILARCERIIELYKIYKKLLCNRTLFKRVFLSVS